MSFKNRCTISSSYEFQAHQQHSQRRCCFSQNALLWFEVLPDAHRCVAGAPRCSAMQGDPAPGRLAACNSPSEGTRFRQSRQSRPEHPGVSDGNQGCCWWGPSQLHSTGHSQPATLFTPMTLSGTFPFVLNNTTWGSLTICSQIWSQYSPKYTAVVYWSITRSTFSTTHQHMLTRTCPIVRDHTVLGSLALHYQVHTQEVRHSRSRLTICSHVCCCVPQPETF